MACIQVSRSGYLDRAKDPPVSRSRPFDLDRARDTAESDKQPDPPALGGTEEDSTALERERPPEEAEDREAVLDLLRDGERDWERRPSRCQGLGEGNFTTERSFFFLSSLLVSVSSAPDDSTHSSSVSG